MCSPWELGSGRIVSGVLPHSKLIASAARDVFRPLGLVQRGRSRTWVDDRAWWLAVVEFQPSSWSRGSYLNVGVSWLWNAKEYLSFDYGHRVMDIGGEGQYVEYQSDEQFRPLALKLAEAAASEVQGYCAQFPDVATAAAVLAGADDRGRHGRGGLVGTTDLLRWLDAGIALGVAGQTAAAQAAFDRYLHWHAAQADVERLGYEVARYDRARELRELVPNTEAFGAQIHSDVEEGRAMLKLEAAELPF